MLDLTGSARDLGFVLAAKTAPLAVFLLAGGVFADRLPRRGAMLTADVARMAIQAATAARDLLDGWREFTARTWVPLTAQEITSLLASDVVARAATIDPAGYPHVTPL